MSRIVLAWIIGVACCGLLGRKAAAAPPVRQPVAIAYLASLDRVIDDVDYILNTGGQPQIMQFVTGFISNLNDLKGIDRTKPVGLYVFMPSDFSRSNAMPDIIGFVPVTSLDELRETAKLSNLTSLEETATPNRFEFKASDKTFAIRVEDGHAFITEKSELLDIAPLDPATLTSALAGDYDVVMQVRKDGVPKLFWDIAVIGGMSEVNKQLRALKKQTDPASQAHYKALELAQQVAMTSLNEVQSVWFGLKISREARTATLDTKLETKAGGRVAQTLAQLVEQPSALADAALLDLPGSLHLAIDLPTELRSALKENLQVVRAEKMPLENVPEPQRGAINSLLDVLGSTLDAGRMELLLQFTGEAQTGMTLVGGVHVADGASIGAALQTLLPVAGESDQVAEVTLKAGDVRGVQFSRIEGEDPKPGEERFYGGKPSLYVGTEPSTLWVLIGRPDALKEFEKLPGEPRTTRPPVKAIGQFHLHLSDWLGVLGSAEDSKTQKFTEAARKAIKDPERDGIHVQLLPEKDGLRLSLTFDEAFLNLVGSQVGK